MRRRRWFMWLCAASVSVLALSFTAALGVSAASIGATANLTGGSLSLAAPATITFAATLTGSDQTVTTPQAVTVTDATGWHLSGTSTTFTTSGTPATTLPVTSVSIAAAPTAACATGSTCTLPTNQETYPYPLPAGTTAPSATNFFDAKSGTGMGSQAITSSWGLFLPGSTTAGTYTSTWTITLATGP
jgi:hypothetical protein